VASGCDCNQSLLTLIPTANLVGTRQLHDPNTFNLFSGGNSSQRFIEPGFGDI